MTLKPPWHALALIATVAYTLGAGGAPAEDEAGEGTGELAPDVLPTLDVRLAPVEGFDDDAAFVQSTATRATELALQADETADLPTRTDLLLAAANLILARELEPACTRRLLGLTGAEVYLREDQIRGALERADAMLVKADAVLDQVRDQADPPTDWVAEAAHRLATLGAFAHALEAYLSPGESPGALDAIRRAASRLAVLLEDDRPPVTAAAMLWQASLRAREADPSRAMSVLGLVLSHPRQGTLPFAFFARLLRCRILASGGGYVVALALLTQLEDRSDTWLATAKDRTDALRAITFVEIQILRDWRGGLSSPPDSPSRQWCTDRINTLIQDRFSEDGRTVLRLGVAIPIIAAPDDAGRREPEEMERKP